MEAAEAPPAGRWAMAAATVETASRRYTVGATQQLGRVALQLTSSRFTHARRPVRDHSDVSYDTRQGHLSTPSVVANERQTSCPWLAQAGGACGWSGVPCWWQRVCQATIRLLCCSQVDRRCRDGNLPAHQRRAWGGSSAGPLTGNPRWPAAPPLRHAAASAPATCGPSITCSSVATLYFCDVLLCVPFGS